MMLNTNQITARFTAHSISVFGLLFAGLIHLALTPEHLPASPVLGLGFFGVAVLQLSLGGLFLLRRTPQLEPIGLVLTVTSLSVYTISRIVGLSFGHTHTDQPMYFELLCKSAELLVVGALMLRIMAQKTTAPQLTVWQPIMRRTIQPLSLAALGVLTAVCLVALGGRRAAPQSPLHTLDDHHSTTLTTTHKH